MGTGVDADRGTGSAAKAREPGVALLFRRASALALVGMADFTDIVITRRRAGWPVRRVSVRSRITRQSPAYAPFVAFAEVSVAPPTIASADTASRIRFITVSTPIARRGSVTGTLSSRNFCGTICSSAIQVLNVFLLLPIFPRLALPGQSASHRKHHWRGNHTAPIATAMMVPADHSMRVRADPVSRCATDLPWDTRLEVRVHFIIRKAIIE